MAQAILAQLREWGTLTITFIAKSLKLYINIYLYIKYVIYDIYNT